MILIKRNFYCLGQDGRIDFGFEGVGASLGRGKVEGGLASVVGGVDTSDGN